MEHKFVTIVKDNLAEKAGGGGSSGTGGTSASGPVTTDYFGVHPETMAKRGKFW
jgi:hypothetical protein